jgi:protein-disulfide isomerase
MMGLDKPVAIALDGQPAVGAPDAPVVLVVYACARCPFCAKLTPELVRAVRAGPLQGKVRLIFKTFPIRSHPNSKEAGLAFVAAGRLGRFWQYAALAYEKFDDYGPAKAGLWAEAAGLDRAEFERLLADPSTRQQLLEAKKEGLRNKVDATPALFINGRRYFGDLEPAELIDVLEEEFDRSRSLASPTRD